MTGFLDELIEADLDVRAPILGDWTDSVYLSRDTTFGPDDVLVQRVPHVGGLAALTGYSGTTSAILPALTDGDYHVIVVADSSVQVPDNPRREGGLTHAGRHTGFNAPDRNASAGLDRGGR